VPLLLLALVLLTPLVALALMPLALLQRYRVGRARRRARRWVARLNVGVALVSSVVLLVVATVMTYWVPAAILGALGGLGGGTLLGGLGLALSRWESTPRDLHVTPNRWLVLGLVLVVLARVVYGMWRGWYAWTTGGGDGSWLLAAGVPGSLAVGGLVIGYQAAFWFGVGRRLILHARQGATLTIDHATGRITYER